MCVCECARETVCVWRGGEGGMCQCQSCVCEREMERDKHTQEGGGGWGAVRLTSRVGESGCTAVSAARFPAAWLVR